MAVQAQHTSPMFGRNNNIASEDFHNIMNNNTNTNNVNMYGGAYQQILNGAVFSEPESELTCNISASRKRNREDQLHLSLEQQQQLLQQQQQHLILSKLARVGDHKTATSSNSTCLQSSLDENRLLASGGASTSGRSSFIFSLNLNSNLLHQNLEIDALIRLQNEKLRAELEETRKRHCRSLLSVLEQQVLKSLQEKETELANANRRNAELEEKIKQLNTENHIWFNVAKNNEAIACSLKSSLEQILMQNQNQGQIKQGFGDSNDGTGGLADDAESCCNQGVDNDDEDDKTIRENFELKQKRLCKVCHENDVSVLLLPCRHLCLCKGCETKIEACPICNTLKKASFQIFIS